MELDKTIYLDNAATTPLDYEVLQKMLPYFSGRFGNPSSMHASGRRALRALTEARQNIAGVLNAEPDEIIFTGSGTESDNLAIMGIARAYKEQGNHIIISAIEHKAVLQATHELEKEGFEITILPVNRFGSIDVDMCINLVTDKTILISVMSANNEIGTIEPIKELSIALKELRKGRALPFLHTDACQIAGYLSLDVEDLGVDLMTLNSSKIYGPKGVGLLYKRKGIRIEPLIIGGDQEMGLRAGTESLPLIIGFAEALIKAESLREQEVVRMTQLRDYLIIHIMEVIPDALLNGHPTKRLPNNVHVSVPNIEGEAMLLMFDHEGIEVSTGSACGARDLLPSHVLRAIGHSPEFIHGSVRFSLGKHTTKEELDRVVEVFPRIVEHLTNISALTARI